MKKAHIITVSIISILIIAVLTVVIVLYAITSDSKLDENKLRRETSNLNILDNANNPINYGKSNYVEYDNISHYIADSFVALEDKRFYSHNGLDYKRIAGAIINNIKAGGFKEGASTISQQLIKNTHLTNEKTIIRKLNEAKLARELEKSYSKENILEMYLNVIYFGSGIYGVQDACMSFFSKSPKSVTLSEAAVIAGIVKNPKAYSPQLNYDKSMERRNLVLQVMKDNEFITEKEYSSAINEIITVKNGLIENNYCKKYYAETINEASVITGLSDKELVGSGYTIKTFMDDKAQRLAYDKVSSTELNPKSANNLALVIDNRNGGIKAYHSNLSISLRNIRAIAGSTLKPFSVYTAAIEQGIIAPADKILDEPININGYSPSNYNDVYHGYVSVRNSIAHSYNIPAVKILNEIGISSGINMLNKFKFNVTQNDENLSLALGSLTVSPITIAGAYSALANGGIYRDTNFVKEIYNQKGKLVYSYDLRSDRIIGEDTAYIVTDMLMSSVKDGTCKKLNYLPYQISAKSGTVASDNRLTKDAWCVAYTTEDTVLSWHGAKKDADLPQSYGGGGYPTMTILSIMRDYYKDNYPSDFVKPSGVQFYPIDKGIYDSDNRVVVGNDINFGDIFSSFHPPKIEINNTDKPNINSGITQIKKTIINDKINITIENLTIGNKYTIIRKQGIFCKYTELYEFIAESNTIDLVDNTQYKNANSIRYKLLLDNKIIANCSSIE